jgi:FKBP-type peptidyl-prolyl cis-trans isomerase
VNQPFSFRLVRAGVIKGWDEGLGYMKTAQTFRSFPSVGITRGDRGVGPIPARTLNFDVELLKIVPTLTLDFDGA